VKIVLPKTLSEPGIIPWEQMFQDAAIEDAKVERIRAKLREYMNYLREHDWTPEANPGNPRFSQESMLRQLRVIARRYGGLDISSAHHPIKGSDGFTRYAYWIYFRVKKDGRKHSKLFTTDG